VVSESDPTRPHKAQKKKAEKQPDAGSGAGVDAGTAAARPQLRSFCGFLEDAAANRSVKIFIPTDYPDAGRGKKETCNYDADLDHESKHYRDFARELEEAYRRIEADLEECCSAANPLLIDAPSQPEAEKMFNDIVNAIFEEEQAAVRSANAKDQASVDTTSEYDRLYQSCSSWPE
jgi:hypothetical protein